MQSILFSDVYGLQVNERNELWRMQSSDVDSHNIHDINSSPTVVIAFD